jgi:hypothetical protein
MQTVVKAFEIAPCGMNCRLCIGYIRERNRCDGCLIPETKCSRTCTIRFCNQRKGKYCDNSCSSFPCKRLKSLDKRYRTNYGMSMIENLLQIEEAGIMQFISNENSRWACTLCGTLICVHRPECLSCGALRNEI